MFRLSSFTGGMAATNGYLLRTEEATLAVDAPEGMADWLAGHGARVDALLLTHQHFDHVLDAARVQADHGCPVFAFSPFSSELTLDRLFSEATGIDVQVEPFAVDHPLGGMDRADIGGVTWSLLHIPGHSPDSLCYYQAGLGLVFGGDVLFMDGVGRTDFPGGSWETLLAGIESQMLALPDDTRLYPGHGPDTTIGRERLENPFLN